MTRHAPKKFAHATESGCSSTPGRYRLHEVLVSLFRERPTLAGEVLAPDVSLRPDRGVDVEDADGCM